jgi:hypothetical protein
LSLVPRLAVLAAALCAGACGNSTGDPGARLSGRVDLTAPAAVAAVAGSVRAARDPWLTRWYGRESAAGAPATIGDERSALLTETPSRLRVDLPAATGARRLRTAARRTHSRSADEPTLRAELFWEEPDAPPRALAFALLAAQDDRWHALGAELPASAGTLWLVARVEDVAQAARPAGAVSWGSPVVAPASPPPLPDLILITVDTLRADAMAHMPRTRALLRDSLWAEQAIAPSNWTLPSFATLWTGRAPHEHGAGRGPFASEPASGAEARAFTALGTSPDFPSALRAAGWATAGVHQNPFLEDWTGLSRGFERWVRVHDEVGAVAGPAEAWWEENAHRPRFLLLHWMTPHLPYGAEDAGDPLRGSAWRDFLAGDHAPAQRAAFFALPEAARAELRRRYAAEVAALDVELGALLPRLLASARDPILLFWSDHGEELWDAGSFEHGHSFDDSVIRVPLGMHWPGHQQARTLGEGVPAGDLGLHLLHVLAGSDARIATTLRATGAGLPPCGLTPECPAGGRGAASAMPLYRAEFGGVEFDAAGARRLLPFTGAGSGGHAPTLDADVARRLAELGYAGR